MIKDWLNNTFFDGNSLITWGQPVLVSNERNLTLAATEVPDALAVSVSVIVAASLDANETEDTFSGAISHRVAATWTIEADGVIIWPQAWTAPVSADREMTLTATEAADTMSATVSVLVSLELSATESQDTFSGTVEAPETEKLKFSEYKRPRWEYPERTVSVRASEQPDRASMLMTVTGISDEELALFMMALMEEEEVLA